MPILHLLDPPNNRIEQRVLDPDDQLPGVLHLGCSLRDYCGGALPEILWADRRLLQAVDLLADRTSLPFSVRSGLSLSRSLSAACGEVLTIMPLLQHSLPPSFLHTALSCGFTAASVPWHQGNTLTLYFKNSPWVIRSGQIGCPVCFLQWGLCALGLPLSITGRLDAPTLSAVRVFRQRFRMGASDLVDQWLLKLLFELTRSPQGATIQVSYGFGGKERGL